MANEPEPEVIHQQMARQRAALTAKLETLENRIVGTVDGVREAVAETVDSVKEGVKDSVTTVKDTVETSVHAVQNTFDLPAQVQRHPWAMVGGAVAVGFAAGVIINRVGNRPAVDGLSRPPVAAAPRPTPPMPSRTRAPGSTPPSYETQAQAPAAEESWATHVASLFNPELQTLKSLAVGTLMAIVREMITDPLPAPMQPQLRDVVDSINKKLGGAAVTSEAVEPLLPRRRHADQHNGHHRGDHGGSVGDDL